MLFKNNKWVCSSVGEHCLDVARVNGSIPFVPIGFTDFIYRLPFMEKFMNILLPDGNTLELENGATLLDAANTISRNLGKKAVSLLGCEILHELSNN